MSVTRTIATLVTAAAIATSGVAMYKGPDYYRHVTITKPHKDLIERFKTAQTGQEYNRLLEEFATSDKLQKYFDETPLEAYDRFRAKVEPYTLLDAELNSPEGQTTLYELRKAKWYISSDIAGQTVPNFTILKFTRTESNFSKYQIELARVLFNKKLRLSD